MTEYDHHKGECKRKVCPYCGSQWIRATSNTTGCCDTERVVRGYEPLPRNEDEPIVTIEYSPFMSSEARRELLIEKAQVEGVDWYDPPPGHSFMAIACRCGFVHKFRSVTDVPFQDFYCGYCEKFLLHWEKTE